jgi:hypothetical protein
MTTSKTPLFIAVPKALLTSLFGLTWGGGLFWAGGGFSSSDLYADSGYFSLRAMGAVIAFIAFCGFLYQIMKMRAPEKPGDRPTEAGETSFDVEAALSNYMASRPSDTLDIQSGARPQMAERKVFGRRSL